LDVLLADATLGDPQSPLRWTCKSTRALAAALTARHHPVSHTTVGGLLRERGYSLQANRKTDEGRHHPDRDAQFRHINAAVKRGLRAGLPVISVDTKKIRSLTKNARWSSGNQSRRLGGSSRSCSGA
jgi:hypothetical protein